MRSHKLKDRQFHGKEEQKINYDLQNSTQKTKHVVATQKKR